MKDIQGGEKKVMKKILSVALSTAMAFSMFASVAFSADAKLTPQQQFDALKAAGIVAGYPDGTAGLDKTITRAELATIIVKAIDLDPIPGVATYKDKNYSVNHWAAKYIEAATEAGILTGKDAVKQLFGPNDNLTVQELAVVLVKALKLEVPAETNNTATEWAKGYVQAAIDKGLIESGINYQANATRSQVVVAAHAIYEANQVPTVASYTVSEAGKVVEFKLSNDEVVKVTLEEALAPNKETEVKFTHNGHEYTHKVTYVTTVAQTVRSVSAADLKQVVVEFDGTVDTVSAEDPHSYSISGKTFDQATLSEDKSSVTLRLDEDSVLTNQKEVEIAINNVKNEDGTKTFTQKVKFTPVDVTTPTVKEVTALGTKAIKVKFSEPVSRGEATKSTNYRINGNVIGASVDYSYPDTVILKTELTEGDHKLSVSNVADFSGLKVVPVENEFTATVDTAAPEIVSIKTNDLKKVTVEFNEPIKRVDSAYANVSGTTPDTIKIEDTKVILTFSQSKPLNYGENTIYLKGVRDYSDNTADREGKVTPTLDTTRPVVVNTEFKTDKDGNFKVELRFNKELKTETVRDRSNYVLKDADGKIADKDGTDSKGNPLATPEYDKNTVTVNLGKDLGNASYTLTVSNLEDTAYVANKLLPHTVNLNAGQVQRGEINRVWLDEISGTKYVYIEFNKAVKASGDNNVRDAAKYSYAASDAAGVIKKQLTENNDDVQLVTSDTIRIETKEIVPKTGFIFASYIAAEDGTYFTQNSSYELKKQVSENVIKLKEAKLTSKEELKLEFDGKISSVDINDFTVRSIYGGVAISPTGYTSNSDGSVITLKFTDVKVPVDPETQGLYVETRSDARSQDSIGNKLVIKAPERDEQGNLKPNQTSLIKDDVAPALAKDNDFKIVRDSVTNATYVAFNMTEAVDVNLAVLKAEDLFVVKVNNNEIDVLDAYYDAVAKQLKVQINEPATIGLDDRIFVKYNADFVGAIKDKAGKNLGSFEATLLYRDAK